MTAQAESARPPWPCPQWSREDPHPAHDWDAPTDGASWCPGVADPDAAAESGVRPVDLAFAALGKWFHGPGYTASGHAKDPDDCGMCWEAAEKATEAVIPAIRAQAIADYRAEIKQLHDRLASPGGRHPDSNVRDIQLKTLAVVLNHIARGDQ